VRPTGCAAVALLVAVCCGCSGEGTKPAPAGTPLPLTTGSWRPGDDAALVGLRGQLAVSGSGCLYVGGIAYGEAYRINVVWPADYSADKDPNGAISLRDQDDAVVAHIGTEISTGGYPVERPSERATFTPACTVPGGEWFVVQDELPPLRTR
jgi:hypothetical protein